MKPCVLESTYGIGFSSSSLQCSICVKHVFTLYSFAAYKSITLERNPIKNNVVGKCAKEKMIDSCISYMAY